MRPGSWLALALLVRKNFNVRAQKDEMRSFVRNDLHSLAEVEQGETANSLVLPLSLSTYSTIRQLAKA